MQYHIKGLTNEEVEQSRQKYGSNAITPQEVESFWDKLIDNFKDPMIIILLVALGIVTVLAVMGFAEWYEGVGIAAAVALATFVSTASEYKNEQTFQKLQEEASRIMINVFRNGHVCQIGIDDVVVGDMVLLQPGDKIPADGRLYQGEIKVNQAMFTGEPEAVQKTVGKPTGELRQLDDPHLVFRGTTVEDGEAVMVVELVGDNTHFGKLAGELKSEEREGPLQHKLGKLAEDIAKFGYIGASFIVVSFIFKVVFMDNDFESAKIIAYLSNWQHALYDFATAGILAVIIIVVAVPEGLPMMIAIVLAQNMRKLLNSNVLVRQLMGIETSGSLNVLFCDKTGTITKGELEAVNFMSVVVPEDSKEKIQLKEYPKFREMPDNLKRLLDISLRNNTSCVIDITAENKKDRLVGGNVTERSLLRFIESDTQPPLYPESHVKLIKHIRFNPIRKFSASRISLESGEEITLIKGAPEKILDQCSEYYRDGNEIVPLTEKQKEEIALILNQKAEEGYRIIAFATGKQPLIDDQLQNSLTLLGFISVRDELRNESSRAIEMLQQAGIQVVMLTGDKLGTAKAIARDVGMLKSETDLAYESSELNKLPDEELHKKLPNLKIVARCLPSDKKRLVKTAQDLGYVVGMTGDGVNDAPALSNCDVGFGMGSGSEVAKEASEVVILDNNVYSIANAVHYGRTIYRSIQKFITFQLTVNVSAILVAFIGPFLGFRLPLTMIQLLWINLIMDTLAALAFSGEPPLERHMKEKPKKREEHIITKDMWSSILINGFYVAALSVLFLKSTWIESFFHSKEAFMTGFFGFFVFIHNFNKFNARVEEMDLMDHIFENKGFLKIVGLIFGVQIILTYFGGDVFRTVALQPKEWLFITILSFSIIPVDLLRKSIRNIFFMP